MMKEVEAKYHELLYAVGNKYPDETRHETALRRIRNGETLGEVAKAQLAGKETP